MNELERDQISSMREHINDVIERYLVQRDHDGGIHKFVSPCGKYSAKLRYREGLDTNVLICVLDMDDNQMQVNFDGLITRDELENRIIAWVYGQKIDVSEDHDTYMTGLWNDQGMCIGALLSGNVLKQKPFEMMAKSFSGAVKKIKILNVAKFACIIPSDHSATATEYENEMIPF